jgi:cysteine desulfurase
MDPIYLDHNSTTPLLPEVVEAMRPHWHKNFGNPASAHQFGRRARQALEAARERVAQSLDAEPSQVLFTSGATEANNLALFGATVPESSRIIASPIEHPSVSGPLAELARRGIDVQFLPVDLTGVVRAEALPPMLGKDVALITAMLVNNETGAVQPVQQLVELARHHLFDAAFHCDAVQAVGKMPVSFRGLGVTSLSLSAHKFGGPCGVGALLVRQPQELMKPLFFGGHQQRALRPGTESVALAVGLAKALELAHANVEERQATVAILREHMLQRLRVRAAPIVVNGPANALPHTLNISFPGCQAETLLIKLDLAGVACSTGSACSSGSLLPSPVLRAMGCPPEVLHSAMRFSFSHTLRLTDIEEATRRIARAVNECREKLDD